jgi:hypothetical protein
MGNQICLLESPNEKLETPQELRCFRKKSLKKQHLPARIRFRGGR